MWDTYVSDSLKESTREKRQDVRRKVLGKKKLPGNWMDFLRDPLNKKELFAFLASKVEEWAKAIQVRTDVVVILGGTFHDLIATHPLADIWVAFGMGKSYRVFFYINAICASLGNQNHERYLYCMHFQVVIQPLPSTATARCQFGRPGMFMKTSQRRFCISPVIASRCWMSRITITIRSRD